jgi:hypothetical protein
MSLSTVTTGQVIAATHVNQLVNVLQVPSGGTESGGYFLTFAAYVNAAVGGTWINSESRGSVPVSVAVNTSMNSPSNCGSPSTDHVTLNGFHVYAFANNGVQPSCNVGGVYTLQY